MANPLDKLNAAIFRQHLNSRFTVNGDPPLTLELVEVGEPPSVARVEVFCLYLRGPQSPRLPQRIHALEHAQLGKLEIFLTAISADADGTVYESVFNRLRPKPASSPSPKPTS